VIQRAVAYADRPDIQLDALPTHVQRPSQAVPQGDASLRAWTARHVVTVLEQCGGNKRLACRRLGISYHTLQAHLAKRRPLGHAA
jgi:ActR/RegA family two-component response regulator